MKLPRGTNAATTTTNARRIPSVHYFYCEAGQWFVCLCPNIRVAKAIAVKEFGRGHTRVVRRATVQETQQYKVQSGRKTIPVEEYAD